MSKFKAGDRVLLRGRVTKLGSFGNCIFINTRVLVDFACIPADLELDASPVPLPLAVGDRVRLTLNLQKLGRLVGVDDGNGDGYVKWDDRTVYPIQRLCLLERA